MPVTVLPQMSYTEAAICWLAHSKMPGVPCGLKPLKWTVTGIYLKIYAL